MILDTSFLIDLIQGEETALDKLEEIEERNVQQKISSATVFELFSGVKRSDKPEEEKEKVLEIIASKQVLEADYKVMEKAGKIHGRKITEGERVHAFDTVIAATADIEQQKILTSDRDFGKLDVETERY